MKAKRSDTLIKKIARNGKYYFTRVSSNGEQVFRSQLYAYAQGRNKAVNRILSVEKLKVILSQKTGRKLQKQ